MNTFRFAATSPSILFAGLIVAACNMPQYAGAQDEPAAGAALEVDAVSPDEAIAGRAIASLRAQGPRGLRRLLQTYRSQIAALSANAQMANDPLTARVRTAIDRVAAQRDAFASGLYWYTDLDDAKREAARLSRPILSLRLLGRLDEEYSCANSRLFRTTLYPSARVAARLRDTFVLHWSSERPAPIVRIDMGDGRTVTRTITGNSVHYVLDAEGRPIDALPGLYGPATFLAKLEEATNALRHCSATPATSQLCLQRWHAERLRAQETEWAALQRRSPELAMLAIDGARVSTLTLQQAPSATVAMPRTFGKMAMEMPVLRVLGAVNDATPEDRWTHAARLVSVGELDAASLSVIRLKLDGGAFDQARLQANIALDTVRNEYEFHRRIHRLLESVRDFESLNTEIYASIFLTPRSDPWLGLRADDLFDALEEVHVDLPDAAVRD